MSDTKLLPCPFCGGKPHLTPHDSYQRGYSGMYVSCTRKSCKVSTKVRPTRLKAAEDWNRRTPDPRLAVAEQMATALKEQHDGLDILFALLIQRDPTFSPSKSGKPWDALVLGNAARAAWEKLNPPPTPEAAQ